MSFKKPLGALVLAGAAVMASSGPLSAGVVSSGPLTGPWDTTNGAISLEARQANIFEKLDRMKMGSEIYRLSVRNSTTGVKLNYNIALTGDAMTITEDRHAVGDTIGTAIEPSKSSKVLTEKADILAFRALMEGRGFWDSAAGKCPDIDKRTGFTTKSPGVTFISGVSNRRYDEVTFEGANSANYCRIELNATQTDHADGMMLLLEDLSHFLDDHEMGRDLKDYVEEYDHAL